MPVSRSDQPRLLFGLLFPCVLLVAAASFLTGCGEAEPEFDPSTQAPRIAPLGYIRVPGTRVSFDPPGGFRIDPGLPGFTGPEPGVSVMVIETASGIEQAGNRLRESQLKERGITLLEKETIDIDGYPAILHRTAEVENEKLVERWIAVFGDVRLAVLIYGAYPGGDTQDGLGLGGSMKDLLKEMIVSAHWDRYGQIDAFEGLRYTLGEAPGMAPARRLGSLVTIIPEPFPRHPVAGGPVFIASQGSSREARHDPLGFTVTRVYDVANLSKVTPRVGKSKSKSKSDGDGDDDGEVTSAGNPDSAAAANGLTRLTLDGLDGYEGVFDAKDRTGRDDMVLYQAVVFDGPTFYLMQATTDTKRESTDLPAFRATVRTFTRK